MSTTWPQTPSCDFAEHVPSADRAGLEAAIEAAGLLDAWVGEQTDDMDAWVRPGPVAATPSLAEVLVPTPPAASGLGADVVGSVLASISLAVERLIHGFEHQANALVTAAAALAVRHKARIAAAIGRIGPMTPSACAEATTTCTRQASGLQR